MPIWLKAGSKDDMVSVDEILSEPFCRMPSLSLVLAILTAYYYAILTKAVTNLRRLRTFVLDIVFWETWGLNGKVSKLYLSADPNPLE